MSDAIPMEAEQALLGAWLTEPASWDLSADLYVPGMFGGPWHNLIADAASKLLQAGRAADPVLVAQGIPEPTDPDGERPFTYVLKLARAIGSGAQARYYAEQVRKAWALREARAALQVALEEGTSDAGLLIEGVQARLGAIEVGEARQIRTMAQDAMEFMEELDAERRGKAGTEIRRTGYTAVDEVTGGFETGLPHLYAARPGGGKSALAVALCRYSAGLRKEPTGLLWFEDTRRKAMLRIAAQEATIPAISLRHGSTVAPQSWGPLMAALERVSKWPLYIESTKGLTPRQVAAVMRRMRREKGVQRFYCDHLSRMNLGAEEGDRRVTQMLGDAFKLFQETMEKLGAGGAMFHQLNREAEKGGPASSLWLYNSDLVYQHARVVGYLLPEKLTMRVTFPKVTYGPPGLSVELGWEPVTMNVFEPVSPQERML